MFRKILSALLIGALILTLTIPALAETAYATCVTPTADGAAYLRSTPGVGQPIVGAAHNGDQLIILQEGNTWHKVQVVRTGVSGWMYGTYIQFSGQSTEINRPGTVSSNAGYAHFRRGPSTSSEVISRLSNGTALQVLREISGWYYVYHSSSATYGYVSASLVTLSDNSINDDPFANVPSFGTAYVSSADGYANLRKGPGTNYDIVASLSNGTYVETYESSNGWTRVNVPSTNHYGYISSKLLKAGTDNPVSSVYATAAIDSEDGYANFRTGPGTNYPIQAKLYNNVLVSLLETDGNWCKVQLSDAGQTGYVYRTLLSVLKTTETLTTTANVNLRSGPGTNYDIRTVVPEGTLVSVLGTEGNFSHVNAQGWIGYVSTNYLK